MSLFSDSVFSPFGGESLREMRRMQHDLNHLFDHLHTHHGGTALENTPAPDETAIQQREEAVFLPRVDVKETETAVAVHAELPGIPKESIKLEINDGVLTLSGERKQQETKQGENWVFSERSYGKFSRSFRLPVTCKEDDISAKYNHGILEIEVPKVKPAPPKSKSIAIN
eukprot:Platyproteum_vivax@DN14761_c0_g1_i1.p1